MLVPGLLAGSILMAPEPQARPALSPDLLAAAAESNYRLGYTSTEHPTLRVAAPGQSARSVLPAAQRGYADLDPDVRGAVMTWVSQRAPDGDSDPDGDVYLQRSGAAPVRLTNDPATESQPAVSPDGSRVAFVSDRSGSDDVWIVQANGTGLRRLTDHPGEDRGPTWSPDGTRIAFSSTRDDPAGDIYVVSAAGGQPTRLTSDAAADTEPAWSPDGARIAFTTTRFAASGADAPATEVVTMPAGGGAATRVVPRPWDSAEPAWAPDSQRLAFTTTRNDPAGDVYLVNGTAVTPISASTLADRGPTWRGGEVVYTSADASWPSDVWTADSNGQDRRDRTARPGFAETGPAFSANGTRLAYSADQPGGGARIIVADPDGRNPRALAPPGTKAGDRDTDPVWSPDGNLIAFTREPAHDDLSVVIPGDTGSRILVVGADDGRLLSRLPMPAHLRGDDREATWSPDGTQLAISRTATQRRSILGWPVIDQPSLPGRQFTAPQTVQTPGIPPKPDVMFLVDDTSSMSYPGEDGSSVIGQLKARIPEVINSIGTGTDARFGLATFSGEGDPQFLYHLRQPLTASTPAMQAAVNTLNAGSIYGTENWFYALRQLAGGDPTVGFRPDSTRIVVLISDTYSMDKYTPDGRLITFNALRDALVTAGITLIGVPIVGANFEAGLDNDPDGSHIASSLAAATGGRLTANSQPGQMIAAIEAAIRQVPVTVQPEVEGCDPGLAVDLDPDSVKVPAGDLARFEEHVTVAQGVPPGTVLQCSIRFDVNVPQPGLDSRQILTVRVGSPGEPFVRVDDVSVTATGPNGGPATFRASATDNAGKALPTRCTPPSGQTFPVGQTVVTCSAVDGRGRVGRDVATITVVDPEAARVETTRIWRVRIAAASVDQITFSDQHDLSILVGEPCRARSSDRAPAWSPDGKAIAFTDGGDPASLCVVNADGSGARNPLSASDQARRGVADPAWAPDGGRIAVALSGSEGGTSIATLPSGGGPAKIVIADVGMQPTYQRIGPPDLSLSVSVGPQPGYLGGNNVVVTFTARNTARPVNNAWLGLSLPPALLPVASVDSRCNADGSVCQLGRMGVGDQQVITVVLPAQAAISAAVAGRLTATVENGAPATRFAQAPIRVLAPTLGVNPAIGPPGFVTEAVGANFPPNTVVQLDWDLGITATPNRVTVQPDGTFRTQVLILRKDQLGERRLTGVLVSGTPFGPTVTEQPFLVVPRTLGPPDFYSRR